MFDCGSQKAELLDVGRVAYSDPCVGDKASISGRDEVNFMDG